MWDATCERAPGSTKGRQKGKQVYLGGYASELEAARAFDRRASARPAAAAAGAATAPLTAGSEIGRPFWPPRSAAIKYWGPTAQLNFPARAPLASPPRGSAETTGGWSDGGGGVRIR